MGVFLTNPLYQSSECVDLAIWESKLDSMYWFQINSNVPLIEQNVWADYDLKVLWLHQMKQI